MAKKMVRVRKAVAFAAANFALLVPAAASLGATACVKSKKDDNASSQSQALATADAATAATTSTSSANSDGSMAAPTPIPRIPTQMFDACAGKAASDPCQVSFNGTRTLDGACTPAQPPETRLVCRLKNPGFFGNRPHARLGLPPGAGMPPPDPPSVQAPSAPASSTPAPALAHPQ